MITIDLNSPDIQALLEQYYKYLRHFLKLYNQDPANINRLNRLILKHKNTFAGKCFLFLKSKFSEIIRCIPADLKDVNSDMLEYAEYDDSKENKEGMTQFRDEMEYLYNYFIQSKIKIDGDEISVGRWLTSRLDLWVCPYCNHNYTLTVNDIKLNKGFRPSFDHFLPKSKYPLLALSFFNLIPSCSICNTIKGTNEIFHNPYDPAAWLKFAISAFDEGNNEILMGLNDTRNKLKIMQETNYSLENPDTCNVKVLMLEQVYDHHIDYVNDILDKAQGYSVGHYDGLVQSFQGLGKTPGDIDRIIWSAYRDSPSKRPLSKLSLDVLNQIGL